MRTFGAEKTVYWREASSGINTVAYFLAKNIIDLPFILINVFGKQYIYIAYTLFFDTQYDKHTYNLRWVLALDTHAQTHSHTHACMLTCVVCF